MTAPRQTLGQWLTDAHTLSLAAGFRVWLDGIYQGTRAPTERKDVSRQVLIVDDVPLNRKLLRAMAEAFGLKVVEAPNGLEALQIFAEQRFDLVLMDLRMPLMDGLVATEAIRLMEQKAGWRRTVVLAVTAEQRADVMAGCEAAGLDEVYEKPVLMPHMRSMLAQAGLVEAA